jgi:hypothetical protein
MKYSVEQLESSNLVELRQICKELSIVGMSKQRKDVIIDEILLVQDSASMPEAIRGSFKSVVTNPNAKDGEKTETKIKVSCGASSDKFSVCGKRVGAIAEILREVLNVDRMSVGVVNGEEVDDSYIIEQGDTLEFLKPTGGKGEGEAPEPTITKPTMKEVHNRPEVREKHKNAMKAAWANPEIKAKIKEAMKAARAKKLLAKASK